MSQRITTLSISALLGITVYSIIYGVLEYFLFHSPNYDGFLKISKYFPNMYFYWSFMLLSAIGFTAIFCQHWIITLWSMWLFPVLEDLFFFISLGLHKREYPFPVPCRFQRGPDGPCRAPAICQRENHNHHQSRDQCFLRL